MFKWPGIPSPRARSHEEADYEEFLAWKQEVTDFSELLSWRDGIASARQVFDQIAKLDENDYLDGVPEIEEMEETIKEEVMDQVAERSDVCGDRYPFEINSSGSALKVRSGDKNKHVIYKYLLLATRLDMNEHKIHANLDGTELFEELCAQIGSNYFGKHSKSFVFGTANGLGNFELKIDTMCSLIGEGEGYNNNYNRTANAKDDGLDIAIWIPFSDDRAGKLIGFGQCKTGTHDDECFTRLQPDAFCKNWLKIMPTLTPVRMFFVAEALLDEQWSGKSSYAGILLDRSRIIEYCNEIDSDLLYRIVAWTSEAAMSTGILAP